MPSNYKPLRKFIREVKSRNADLSAKELLGINIDKFFMPSVANIVGTDLSKYKLVRENQFACNRMHVGRDGRIPVALSRRELPFMVSPAYNVFEIKDPAVLLPEYLMMWFSRREFDRNAWFFTDADVRGGLAWSAFCDTELPVPAIAKQREIVAEYHTIQNRIALNNQLIQTLETTAQAIYKQWFVEFEFPNEAGQPYKSSGGEMVDSELGEIPKGWSVEQWGDIASLQYGKGLKDYRSDNGTVPVFGTNGQVGITVKPMVNSSGIIIGRKGIYRGVHYSSIPFYVIDTAYYLKPIRKISIKWAFLQICKFDINGMETGSAIPSTSRDDFYSLKSVFPELQTQMEFEKVASTIFTISELRKKENTMLAEASSLLLSKLATIETTPSAPKPAAAEPAQLTLAFT